ncbi:hypothetical protein [Streptomyces sp. NRRL WC-3742]|uniref:hypothetical protein n=1 Tax=Streptomyces sp. NRRL WC-3742 TaxID=1463934 RepID=UPI0004C5A044|nr:hypothetical protein [Streptomyces sp. NRRL WC-3742]
MSEHDHPQPEADLLVDVTPAAPRPRSRARLWRTVATAAALGAVWFGVDFADNFANLGAYRYEPPKTFDGLPLDPQASRAKRTVSVASDSGVSATTYLSADQERMVFVTVYEKHIFTPASELDDLTARQRSNVMAPADLHKVDAGDREGVMKCGSTEYEGHRLAVCDWADGSMWGTYNESDTDPDTAAAHARDFRRQAEVPS